MPHPSPVLVDEHTQEHVGDERARPKDHVKRQRDVEAKRVVVGDAHSEEDGHHAEKVSTGAHQVHWEPVRRVRSARSAPCVLLDGNLGCLEAALGNETLERNEEKLCKGNEIPRANVASASNTISSAPWCPLRCPLT